MLDIRPYKQYNGEKRIAVMDNSLLAFMHELKHKGYSPESLFSDYDLILIPGWVQVEVEDSEMRAKYLQTLINLGYPVYSINEADYSDLVNHEELNLYEIVLASVNKIGALRSYLRRNVSRSDPLDIDSYREWIQKMYRDWPIPGEQTMNRDRKKNAGEISITILAEILSWYYPNIEGITVYSSDADTYEFIISAEDHLRKFFSNKSPIPISYKSTDSVLCQMYLMNLITLEQAASLRPNPRTIRYIRVQADNSVSVNWKVINAEEFLLMIQDSSIRIIF